MQGLNTTQKCQQRIETRSKKLLFRRHFPSSGRSADKENNRLTRVALKSTAPSLLSRQIEGQTFQAVGFCIYKAQQRRFRIILIHEVEDMEVNFGAFKFLHFWEVTPLF